MTHDQRGVLEHGLLIFAVTCGVAILGAAASAPTELVATSVSVPYALALVLVGTACLLLALRFTKGGKFFEALFSIAMLTGAWYLFDLVFPRPWGLLAAGAMILARVRFKNVWVFNLTMAIGIAGIAASAASDLSANAVLTIFTFLAFYDIVAVYATGHMVRMFRGMASRGVLLAFVLPPFSAPTLAEQIATSTKSSKTFYLGTGDVALPAMLAAAAVRGGIAHGLFAAVGSLVGYALMFDLFTKQKERRPMPALPPIALGTAVGYLLSLILLP